MTHGLSEQLLVSLVSPAHVMLLTTFDLTLNSDPVPQVTLQPDHSDHTVGPVEKNKIYLDMLKYTNTCE